MPETQPIKLDAALGDGPLIALLPLSLRRRLRRQALASKGQCRRRLMRAARRVYPQLQLLEPSFVPEDALIAAKPFDDALRNARCIERALHVFERAMAQGEVVVRGRAGMKPLAADDTSVLGSCGMTIQQVLRHFVAEAANLLFDRQTAERLVKSMDDANLPKLRIVTAMNPLALGELRSGLGARFTALLSKDSEDLTAIAKLKPYQLRALRVVLEKTFPQILDWEVQRLLAFADSFQCVEQFRDVGPEIAGLESPEAIWALSGWEMRDITEKVNAERARQGQKTLKGRRFETDIQVARRLLGGQAFAVLLQREAAIIGGFGPLLKELRELDDKERPNATEALQTFGRRYLGFFNAAAFQALTLDRAPGRTPLAWAEVLGILDGLWSKQGLGARFFEEALATPEGEAGLRGLVDEYNAMKERGSIKPGTDINAIIAKSDLLDRPLLPLLRKAKPVA